jgi:hypothetical protein
MNVMDKWESRDEGRAVEGWGSRCDKWIVDIVATWGFLLIEGVA